MYVITDSQAVSLMNRINDIWEVPTDQCNFMDYVAATQRLLGALNIVLGPDNYCSERKGNNFEL